MKTTSSTWLGIHRGNKSGKAGPSQPVEAGNNPKLVGRLLGRRAAHAKGLQDAANKRHGHQVPGSMKKVY